MPPLDGNNARAHPVSRGIEPVPRDEGSVSGYRRLLRARWPATRQSVSITQARIWRKILEFVRLPLPLFPVGRGRFFDLNIRPDFRVFCIQRQPFLKAWLDISLDGIDGTLRLANATVDTFVRMDDEHILALVEGVHGAHCNAVHGFAANTAIVDDVSQLKRPFSRSQC